MAHINKQTILKAYKELSEMRPDPIAQGATQNVSILRYFSALDRFFKENNRPCDTRDKGDKAEFTKYVGEVCAVTDNLYTPNFYFPIREHNGDYNVGSNFYSVGQVKVSLADTSKFYPYPVRVNAPLFEIRNGVLYRKEEYYENINSYLTENRFKVAFTLWILRDVSIEESGNLIELIQSGLLKNHTDRFVDVIIPDTVEINNIIADYNIIFVEDFKEITSADINGLFDKKPYVENPSTSLQQIFYGAPGTGKSYTIQQRAPQEATIRTTFHPDSDYSTFVGAYKPTMCKTGEVNAVGKDEEKISYRFVPQAFLKAYIKAWKNYPKSQYLVIEEINRGNCAQIFGDLFQLLDRGESGFSEYPIDADDDIRQYISEQGLELNGCDLPDTVKDAVIKGEKLILPSNLYVWATMNTSDQSLFPIDSAFKRRWDWVYVPIANVPDKDWKIKVGDALYDWWTFVDKINGKIQVATESQDKKLGYFFAKADKSGLISTQNFVGKVLFYLWNDVFRDYPLEGDDLLQDGEHTFVFEDFFNEDGSVNIQKVKKLLSNLGVGPDQTDNFPDVLDDEDEGEGRDQTKYNVNGDGPYAKRTLVWEIVRKYIAENAGVTADHILQEFAEIKGMVSHGIETKSDYDARQDSYKNRVKEVNCNGEIIYVSTDGWGGKETMNKLMRIVNRKPWGITVTEA